MHKKLESDLISLAHSILKMKNKDDVFALKGKAKEVYEKLTMLAFVEEYINVTPNLKTTKEELVEKIENAFDEVNSGVSSIDNDVKDDIETTKEKVVHNLYEQPKIKEEIKPIEDKVTEEISIEKEEILEQPFDDFEKMLFANSDTATNFKNDVKDVAGMNTPSLEEELKDTISVDFMADLFENAQPKSINDKFAANIQIGLNDRIAFVKNLFDGDQENYNRVVSQLNTFKNVKEAKKFITKMVKPDYNWSEQEELEMRFMEIIERKFA
jgi:hypothetical protein